MKVESHSYLQSLLTVSIKVETPEESLKVLQALLKLDLKSVDRLNDATRPGGTPPSTYHRELEDVVEGSEGALEVTHAAGGLPVIVPKGEAPISLPAETKAPRKTKPKLLPPTTSLFPPTNRPRQGLDPSAVKWPEETICTDAVTILSEKDSEAFLSALEEPDPLDEAEKRSKHARRWHGKVAYNGMRIEGVSIKGDYQVNLHLVNGEDVVLDDNDVELSRKLRPAEDNKGPADQYQPEPAPGEIVEPEPAPNDIPDVLLKGPGSTVKQILEHYVKPEMDLDEVAGALRQLKADSVYSEHWSSMDITDRALRVLVTTARVTSDEAQILKGRM